MLNSDSRSRSAVGRMAWLRGPAATNNSRRLTLPHFDAGWQRHAKWLTYGGLMDRLTAVTPAVVRKVRSLRAAPSSSNVDHAP